MTSLAPIPRWARAGTTAVAMFAVSACADSATAPSSSSFEASPSPDAVQFNEALATVAWNGVARSLTNKYPTSQQGGTRLFAYLSLAQYDAVIAAEDGKDNGDHPSPAAAVAGASAVVLAAHIPPKRVRSMRWWLHRPIRRHGPGTRKRTSRPVSRLGGPWASES